jgi:hypothetical protein
LKLKSSRPRKFPAAYGQVGFVYTVNQNGKTNPVKSFTSLHDIIVEDDKYKFCASLMKVENDLYYLDFPDCEKVNADLVPYALRQPSIAAPREGFWKNGIDLTNGSVPDFVSVAHSFQMVREDFVLKKRQKIGIAVAMPPHDGLRSSLQKAYPHLNESALDDIYGVASNRKVNVYTGEILYVGVSHIEYDNNTFEGCSGAIVFLLDKDQPEFVKESDHGCAIAVMPERILLSPKSRFRAPWALWIL